MSTASSNTAGGNPDDATPRVPVRGDHAWRDAGADGDADAAPVCRWNFEEDPGEVRWSTGRERYGLHEMAGPVDRGRDGPGGGATLELGEAAG